MPRARSTASSCASSAAPPRSLADLAEKWDVSEDGKVSHLPSAQGREMAFGRERLHADARFQRRRRALLLQPAVEAGPSLRQGLGRQIRLLQRHGHAEAPGFDREEGRLHGRLHADPAERADPRQSRDGLRDDPIGRIRRLPDEEGHARAVRPDPGRHRPVPVRHLSEGRGDPLQGQPELLCAARPRSTISSTRSRPTRPRASPS